MQYKTTTRLFKGTYQYKIVLVCQGSNHFRKSTFEAISQGLLSDKRKNPEDINYALKLQSTLSAMKDIDVRVEAPWVSVYTNNQSDLDKLVKIGEEHVKYISKPAGSLEEGTVLMPKMDYEFRVTLGKTIQEHTAFIEWAESNSKVKLTKSCINDLTKPRSWGGKHFYITGNNNLLMARMHLGGSISKVERIVKN
jgi:hypothetical protein